MIKKSNKTWLVGLTLVILSLTVVLALKGCTQKEDGSGNVIILKTFRDTFPRYFFAPHYVYVVAVPNGGFTAKIPRGLGDEPRWSKDGKWIVFSTIWVDDLEDSEIYMMRSEGG